MINRGVNRLKKCVITLLLLSAFKLSAAEKVSFSEDFRAMSYEWELLEGADKKGTARLDGGLSGAIKYPLELGNLSSASLTSVVDFQVPANGNTWDSLSFAYYGPTQREYAMIIFKQSNGSYGNATVRLPGNVSKALSLVPNDWCRLKNGLRKREVQSEDLGKVDHRTGGVVPGE